MPYITIDLSNISSNSTNTQPPTPEQSLLKEIEARAKDNPELAQKIKEAAERAEKARNERIQKALEGSAELALLEGPQGKRFFLMYFYRNETWCTPGIAYAGYDASEEKAKELEENTVLLQADNDPFLYCKYETIRELKKVLESHNAPYVIKFFDN